MVPTFDTEEKKHDEAYQNLVHLFGIVHIDNMRIIKALICQKDDVLPLVDGATKNRVCNCSLYFLSTLLTSYSTNST